MAAADLMGFGALCLVTVVVTGCQDYTGLVVPGIGNFTGDASVEDGDQGRQEEGADRPRPCVEMEYLDFGMFTMDGACVPVDPMLPECQQADDQGALVARTVECIEASLEECGPWAHDDSWALVLVCDPFGGCASPVTVEGVRDCGDRIEVEFSVYIDCGGDCDSIEISHIPNTTNPVHGIASPVEEGPCP